MSFFSGSTMNVAVEIRERRAPVSWHRYSFHEDSCGAGQYRGGFGSSRLLECDLGDVVLSAIGDRERFTPWGLFGGKNAPPQRIYRHKSGGGTDSMGMFFSNRPLDKHDRIEYLSTGGGGYGPPEKRVLERIIEDVENEFTSLEFVRENYGVVVEAVDPEALDYRVDDAATRELRTEMFGNEWADVPLLADEIAAGEGSTGAGERRVGAQARLDR